MNEPLRGEVWLVDLGLAAKVRPCLVISVPASETDRALVTLIPHTTAVRGTRFECILRMSALKPGAFDAQGLVTVPHSKLLRQLTRVTAGQLIEIERTLSAWLGLTAPANQ